MKRTPFRTFTAAARRFAQAEDGSALVELALALPLFLLIFFGLIDFGRMGAEYVMAEKATQLAARLAVVRPPACAGVPDFNVRGTVPANTVPPKFGSACSSGATVCAAPATVTCNGNVSNTTVAEIWTAIAPIMPRGATPANLSFSYAFDPKLGFLGGPFVPIVTVEIRNMNFQFATPLGGLAALAAPSAGTYPPSTLPFPNMSMSLPAEDLNLGVNG